MTQHEINLKLASGIHDLSNRLTALQEQTKDLTLIIKDMVKELSKTQQSFEAKHIDINK